MLQQIKHLAEKTLQVRVHREQEFGKCYYEVPFGLDLYLDLKRLRRWAPNEVIFDVGANTGATSLQLARHFPDLHIYAFEPVQDTFQQLAERVGHAENVRCFHLAFGSERGSAEMRLHWHSDRNTLRQDLAESGYDERDESEVVEIQTVDGFLSENAIDRIDFLKIDAEGYDLEVLKGAEQALRGGRIRLVTGRSGSVAGRREFHLAGRVQNVSARPGLSALRPISPGERSLPPASVRCGFRTQRVA